MGEAECKADQDDGIVDLCMYHVENYQGLSFSRLRLESMALPSSYQQSNRAYQNSMCKGLGLRCRETRMRLLFICLPKYLVRSR